jgi:FkbM family methyltransferase
MSTIVTRDDEKKTLAWAEEGAQYLSRAESVERTWSRARILESILVELKSPRTIDLLSIDVEGNELAVLEGIDFSLWNFKHIVIETKEKSESFSFLSSHDFNHLATLGNNAWFKHR